MKQAGSSFLVAHRGYSSRYPENTILAIMAAIETGARYVEFDIQLSKDRIPVLCHDSTLLRTAGLNQAVSEITAATLDSIDVSEPARFGTRFKPTRLPRLSDTLRLLTRYPAVHSFIEIKQESIDCFGVSAVVESVIALVHAHSANSSIISFNAECLYRAREFGTRSIGLVTEESGQMASQVVNDLRPEFLFTVETCFRELQSSLSGQRCWAVYHTEDPERALELIQQGADLVETNAIGDMLDVLGRDSR